jgi:hypothetical protein
MTQEKLQAYIESKLQNMREGKPHFVKQLVNAQKDPKEELFNIMEEVWLRNRSLHTLAKNYHTSRSTLYRVLLDLEPMKDEVKQFLMQTPRRKRFYVKELDQSDYETVQNYIQYAHREELKKYKDVLSQAQRCWRHLNCKDPQDWTSDEVTSFLSLMPPASQSDMLVCIRQVAPQIKDKAKGVKTSKYREKIGIRKKDIFGPDVNLIHECLRARGLLYEMDVFDLHITTGAREGSSRTPNSGLTGITWDRFHNDFKQVDLWESKTKRGIWSRNCPVDQFFKDLPERLQALWQSRGKPTNEPIILGGYKELRGIYLTISMTLMDYYRGKINPDILKEFSKINPHDSDKIHCNLLWEADVPLEVVAGQYLGRGEGLGLCGRIWLNIDTIKKHYLSLTQRSTKFQKIRDNITNYSKIFATPEAPQEVSQPVQEVIA